MDRFPKPNNQPGDRFTRPRRLQSAIHEPLSSHQGAPSHLERPQNKAKLYDQDDRMTRSGPMRPSTPVQRSMPPPSPRKDDSSSSKDDEHKRRKSYRHNKPKHNKHLIAPLPAPSKLNGGNSMTPPYLAFVHQQMTTQQQQQKKQQQRPQQPRQQGPQYHPQGQQQVSMNNSPLIAAIQQKASAMYRSNINTLIQRHGDASQIPPNVHQSFKQQCQLKAKEMVMKEQQMNMQRMMAMQQQQQQQAQQQQAGMQNMGGMPSLPQTYPTPPSVSADTAHTLGVGTSVTIRPAEARFAKATDRAAVNFGTISKDRTGSAEDQTAALFKEFGHRMCARDPAKKGPLDGWGGKRLP